MRLNLITFDANNTLIRVKNTMGFEYLKVTQIYCNSNQFLKQNKSLNECENDLTKAFTNVWKEMNKIHENYGVKSGLSSLEWWTQIVMKTFRCAQYSDKQISDKQLDIISKHLFRHFSSANCWTTIADSHKVLTQLKQNNPNLQMGVISNFDERLEHILQEMDLRHYFDFVVNSRLVKYSKPSKKIFDLALKTSGLSDPSKCLHIGDNIDLDYLPAKKFGWNALLFTDISKLSEEKLVLINKNECISKLIDILNFKL